MTNDLHIERRAFADRIANLGFAAPVPGDWIAHELPDEPPNFANPTELVPLAMVTPPHSAIVLAVMARPAFDDGTVHDWTMYLLSAHGMQPRAISIGTLGSLPAIVGEAVQASEIGTVIVRFAFCEDGGRLINISLAAPEMLAPTVTSYWFELVREFTLDTPLGATVPVRQGMPSGAIPDGSAEPAGSTTRPETSADSTATADEAGDETPVAARPAFILDENGLPLDYGPSPDLEDEEEEEMPAEATLWWDDEAGVASANPGDEPAGDAEDVDIDPHTVLATFGLAADRATLDPEHPLNANLRDRGIGLVPNVVAEDRDRCIATIAAGSIEAYIDIPFGWHAIDDGRRTLLFDPPNDVQVNIDLLPREGRSADQVLDAIEGGARSEYPDPRFIRVAWGNIVALGVANIHDGGEELEQYHLLIAGPDPEWLLRARVTASPDRSEAAANLAEAILATVRFAAGDRAEPFGAGTNGSSADSGGRSEVWVRAVALEREGRLEDAEATIVNAIDHVGAYASVAQLFAERMMRLQAAGDRAGAKDAFQRARKAIIYYASLATSGGEGRAFSLERDEFIADLERAYVGDPDPAAADA